MELNQCSDFKRVGYIGKREKDYQKLFRGLKNPPMHRKDRNGCNSDLRSHKYQHCKISQEAGVSLLNLSPILVISRRT